MYREGAETVLFYYALVGDAKSAVSFIYLFAGIIVGAIILTICYFVMRYTVVKLPLKPFFMFTGSFMYLMAFVFAGKSVLELIEGKLFEPTLISGVPEISWLGIYPYMETLIPQAILLVAAVFALFIMKYQSKKSRVIPNNPLGKTMKKALLATALFAGIFTASTANAFQEYPIGEAVTMNEMEIAAVYLKPIDMEPRGMGFTCCEIRYPLRSRYPRSKR